MNKFREDFDNGDCGFFNIHLRKMFKEFGYKKKYQDGPNYYEYLLWLNKILSKELVLLYQYKKENP